MDLSRPNEATWGDTGTVFWEYTGSPSAVSRCWEPPQHGVTMAYPGVSRVLGMQVPALS